MKKEEQCIASSELLLTLYFCLLSVEGEVSLYNYGWRDCVTILFYFFIIIIIHAVVQEYVLDVSMWSFSSTGLVGIDECNTGNMLLDGLMKICY